MQYFHQHHTLFLRFEASLGVGLTAHKGANNILSGNILGWGAMGSIVYLEPKTKISYGLGKLEINDQRIGNKNLTNMEL